MVVASQIIITVYIHNEFHICHYMCIINLKHPFVGSFISSLVLLFVRPFVRFRPVRQLSLLPSSRQLQIRHTFLMAKSPK